MATSNNQTRRNGDQGRGSLPVSGVVHQAWKCLSNRFRLFQLIDDALFEEPISRTMAWHTLWAKYGSKRGDL